VSYNLYKNISQSLELTGLWEFFDKDKIFTRLDFDFHSTAFSRNYKMQLIEKEILLPHGYKK